MSLWNLLNWGNNYARWNAIAEADSLVALAFGFGSPRPGITPRDPDTFYPEESHPGLSNEAIADLIAGVYTAGGEPRLYLQSEVATALRENRLAVARGIPDNIAYESDPSSEYLDTIAVVGQFFDEGDLSVAERIALTVAPSHTFRAKRALKREAKNRELEQEILVVPNKNVPFDPDSAQKWTRDPATHYLKREMLVRLGEPVLAYKAGKLSFQQK